MVNVHGQFVWYELMTTDVEAAKAFYEKVMGWSTWDASMPGMAYSLFTLGNTRIGGLMNLPEGGTASGARPCWVGYISVADVDAAADHITRLGGAVHVPPTDIPDVCHFSIFADPQAATLGTLKWFAPDRHPAPDTNAPGYVGWRELVTTDHEKAAAFYCELFGWQKADADLTALGAYQLFSCGGPPIGGMLTKHPEMPDPFWLYYFNVDDIDAAAKRVMANGGQIFDGPLELPAGTWIVQCTDPQGALFGLEGMRRRTAVGYFERTAPRDRSDPRSRRWSW